MLRLLASIRKEFLLLIRDRAGLAILFLMPMGLILVMTLIQDVSFRKLNESGLSILFLDEDRDSLGSAVRKGLEGSGFFQVVTTLDPSGLTKEKVLKEIARGKYQIGIVIPKGTSAMIRTRAKGLVRRTLSEGDSSKSLSIPKNKEVTKIILVFDPVIKSSFKQSVRNALENFTSRIENKMTFQIFASEIGALMPKDRKPLLEPGNLVQIEEIYATNQYNEVVPNSVQHNVPAWTIFAMFFIVIPLTGNLIKERESGTTLRLRVMPGSYAHVLSSKIFVYLVVCLIQFFLMMLVGIVILPLVWSAGFGSRTPEVGPSCLSRINGPGGHRIWCLAGNRGHNPRTGRFFRFRFRRYPGSDRRHLGPGLHHARLHAEAEPAFSPELGIGRLLRCFPKGQRNSGDSALRRPVAWIFSRYVVGGFLLP